MITNEQARPDEYSQAGGHTCWSLPPDLAQIAADGDPGLVTELIRIFLADTGPRLQRLRQAWENHNLELVRKEAHSLKGSSSQLGALDLSQICKHLEIAANQGADEDVPPLLKMAEDELRTVSAAMRAFGPEIADVR